MKKRLLYWTPPVLTAGLIYFLSSRSYLPGKWLFRIPFFDKFAHAAIFILLSVFLMRALHYAEKLKKRDAAFLAIALTIFYGLTDELHQAFVPLRYCDLKDWLADSAGAVLPFIRLIFKEAVRNRADKSGFKV